ncbi:MAG: NADH-quinone oxidoreductase subunit NuoE, partial [Candidatus Delongbacteria bacterium]|nr:NADH-quinone oxidoreductase subunit NuoE [Candidatus Delongbacteria bacterium]
MIDQTMKGKITELKQKYPKKESAIMPALMLVQKANRNNLSEEDIEKVASIIGVTSGKAFGVVTYYSMYNSINKVGKYHLQVDTNIPATLMGALKIVDHLENKLGIKVGETTEGGLFTLSTVECLGSCGTCPVVQVNDVYYENMTTEKVDELILSLENGIMPEKKVEYNFGTECNVLLKNRDVYNSTSIDTFLSTGGYKALEKSLTMDPQEIIDEVRSANVRGRGGAGFPAGVKWGFVPKGTDKPIYLIC